ncbi:unnamed protein product, partial [Thlaspi arvense]
MTKKNVNTYEEARKKRVEDNKKRFEDFGILKISKSLSNLKSSEKKSVQRLSKPKQSTYAIEPRRSSRARNPVPSYRDDVDIELPTWRKRSKTTWASYLARPLDEVKTATYEERAEAFKRAEKLQSNLQSGNPSFVKSMVRSHVYSCFWLGLPAKFCEDHLPKSVVDVVLEDENGTAYDAIYIGKRAGLSGGWRGFALDHKLDDGDALVFELIKPTGFKVTFLLGGHLLHVYIIRASSCRNQEDEMTTKDEEDSKEKNRLHLEEKPGKKNKTKPKHSAKAKKD